MIVSGAVNDSPKITYNGKTVEQIFRDILTVNGDAIIPENAEKLGAVAAAHRIYTNSIAAMPWQIRRKEGENRYESDHDLSYLLKTRANEYMSIYTAEKMLLSWAFWHGVGYAYIERNKNGKITEIIPIPANPEIRVNKRDNARWYKFTVPDTVTYGNALTREFADSQLLIHRFESYDGTSGRGVLGLARDTIDTDLKAMKYGNRFYSNGARPSGVLEVDGEMSKEHRAMLKDEFNQDYSGNNAFRVAVLDIGMKYTQLGISQQDSQFIENREFTVDEISRFTGIPAYMLQAGKQSYNSNEQQKLDFVVDTLTPHLIQMEQEYKYKLFSKSELDSGLYLKKNVAALLRGTHEARANFYTKMIGIGAMNADEIRADEDRSPIPGGFGQKFWMSKNYAPVDADAAFRASSSSIQNAGKEDE